MWMNCGQNWRRLGDQEVERGEGEVDKAEENWWVTLEGFGNRDLKRWLICLTNYLSESSSQEYTGYLQLPGMQDGQEGILRTNYHQHELNGEVRIIVQTLRWRNMRFFRRCFRRINPFRFWRSMITRNLGLGTSHLISIS
jgi:hypothetical protein